MTAFIGTPPFDELGPAINVFRVNVTSTDSGADDPAAAGGTGATVRTYFDSTFGANSIRRLLVCNTTTALQVAAAQVPEFTTVLVVVNSTIYGGSGGGVGTYSLANGATEIGIHEMGHTAFGLADEYAYYAGGNETGHDHHPAGEPTRAQRHDQHQSQHAEVAVGCRGVHRDSDDEQSGVQHGGHAAKSGAGRNRRPVRRRALLSLRRLPARVRLQDARAQRAVLPRLPSGDLEPHRSARDAAGAAADADLRRGAISRAPRRVRRREQRPHDEQLVGRSSGWAGLFHVQGGIASPGGSGSPVTAISRYSGHLDLFTVGTDNRVYSCWWDAGSGWHPWFPIGNLQCRPGSTVNVVSRYTDHLDLFTTASDGRVMSTWWHEGAGWADWFHVMGGVAANGATVTAIARYPFHLDVFTVGTDNRVYSCWWDDRSGWQPWFPLPGVTLPPEFHGDGGCALPGPDRSLHDRIRRTHHVDVVERPQRLGQLVPGLRRRRVAWVAGDGHRPLLRSSRPVRDRHRQPRLQHLVA